MTEEELLRVVDNEINLSKEFNFGQVAQERKTGYDLYYRKPLGNEIEGRSQVVTADVAMAIDTTHPQLMEMFVASDKAVELQPKHAEDVEAAEQATELCNHVFYAQNRGYQVVYDTLWDGLVQKTGCLKWVWEKTTSTAVETYAGLNEQQLVMLSQDPEVEITNYSPSIIQGAFDVQVRKKKDSGQIRIHSVPVDELLISPRARSYDLYDAPFIAHAPLLTYSELMELGVDPAIIDQENPAGSDDFNTGEVYVNRLERLGLIDSLEDSPDPSQRRYRYYECYLKVDFDGDGIAELRKICKVGNSIVHNDAVDHIPLSYWSPKTMPHEPIGASMADDCGDIQILNTTLWRAGLDGLYLTIAPRTVVDVEANAGLPTLDDVLTVRPGGVIRARGGMNTVQPFQQSIDLGSISNMIEFNRQEADQRTGAYRYGQGLDPNAMNKTATVATLQNTAMQNRLKIYGRNYAEQCLIPCFKGILYLLSQHQQESMAIRIRGQFVPVDPRVWTTEYDMSVNVGLGTGTKEQQFMALMQMGSDQAAIGQSPYAPKLLTPKNVFNLQKKKVELAGYKDAEAFFSDPDKMPDPPPQEPPEIQKAKIDAQVKQADNEQKMQLESVKAEHNQQLDQQKMVADVILEYIKAQMKAMVDERVGLAQAEAMAMQPVAPIVTNAP